MRASELSLSLWVRLRRPTTWGAVLGFGLLWALTRWGFGTPPARWQEFLYPFALPFAYLVLSPVPWQWTGDDRPLAGLFRGFLQALPWNVVWVVGLALALGFNHGGERRSSAHAQRAPRIEIMGLSPRLVVVSMANLSLALLLGWILADKERAERQSSDAVKAAAQAQAQALQAQMNPHVLFNAISGLTELVHEDPQAAEEALVNLASLLRGLLENGARAKLPLASERALVQRYLALESIRLGNRLRVTWEWDEALESRELPPLLLQPLVENAIKHGIAPHRGGAELTIFLRQSEGRLCMGVINGGEPLQEDLQEGVGLRNLRERLALLGEGREAVKLYPHEGRTVAELCLKGGLA